MNGFLSSDDCGLLGWNAMYFSGSFSTYNSSFSTLLAACSLPQFTFPKRRSTSARLHIVAFQKTVAVHSHRRDSVIIPTCNST
jgi:hypothetical protein